MTTSSAEPISSKYEERWFLVRLGLLFLSAVGAFLVLVALRGQAEIARFPRAKLPDGTWLVARAVTVGTSHSVEIPYPMDEQFNRWKRSHTEAYKSSVDRMVIWLTHENDRGEMLDFHWFQRCELTLEDDFPISPEQYQRQQSQANNTSGYGTGSSGFTDAKPFGPSARMSVSLIRFELPLARPRDGKMRLDAYDGSKQIVAQLGVPYPKLPNAPADDWMPDPLPSVRTDGNLQVTLKAMKSRKYQGNTGINISPELDYVHDGQPSGTWVASTDFLDPMGNIGRVWNCDLSTRERAWKMRLAMYQTPAGRFLPEETKKLPLKQVAGARQTSFFSETHTVNGIPVSLRGLGGIGPLEFTVPGTSTRVTSTKYQPGNMSYGMSSSCNGTSCHIELSTGHPFLITNDSLGGGDANVQLVFRDQSGEELTQRGWSGSAGLSFWFYEPKPTTASIEVEIIAQKYRHAEFLIAPPKPDEIETVK